MRLLGWVRFVPAVSILVALVIVGFLTQVADDGAYEGTLRDGVELWAWAFGVAVTGGTVISVFGQLNGATQAPASGKPTTGS